MNQSISTILNEEVQRFILQNENADIQNLLLKQKTVHGVATASVVQQIIGRRKAKVKFPGWYAKAGIIYPPAINLEQSSSESTAIFKVKLLGETIALEKSRGVDLTGGFGIDTYFLSRESRQMEYIEPKDELVRIAQHNHMQLGCNNIQYHCLSAQTYLSRTSEKFDFLYLDPSRRKADKKVYRLTDSEPDVVLLQEDFFKMTPLVLIKTSPLLDLQQGCRELKRVSQVIVVAVENECRELLFLLRDTATVGPIIRAVDLNRLGEIISSFTFTFEEEKNSTPFYAPALKYLYEPNVAILKAGAFKWIAGKFNVKKLAPNTHLYTSEQQQGFPGRTFRIIGFTKLDKTLKKEFAGGHANIISRNYPLSVEEIKKKTGLKEGGEGYLICTQTEQEKLVIVAERIS